jgi:hypothetical protein
MNEKITSANITARCRGHDRLLFPQKRNKNYEYTQRSIICSHVSPVDTKFFESSDFSSTLPKMMWKLLFSTPYFLRLFFNSDLTIAAQSQGGGSGADLLALDDDLSAVA